MPAFRVGDSRHEALIRHTKRQIRALMMGIAGDAEALLTVVADGPFKWRARFLREFRTFPVDQEMADKLYAFFCQQVVTQFAEAGSAVEVEAPKVAGLLLDKMDRPTPPTEAEINAAWEIDSASSEDGRRFFYGPDGSPQETLEKLKAGARPEDLVVRR